MTDATAADLLRDHLHALAALSRRLCRDRHAAADAVQDTLVTALQQPLPRAGSLRAWLLSILRNRARQTGRAERRRIARHLAARHAAAASAPPAGDVADELELHRRLVGFVLALDAPVRQAVFLCYWRGLSPREIAAATGTPLKSVYARLDRGIERLRADLDARPGGRAAWLATLLHLRPTRAAAATTGLATFLAMKTKVLVPAAVALVALALWPFVHAPTPPAPDPAAETSPSVVAAAAGDSQPSPTMSERAQVADLPATPAVRGGDADATPVVTGRVLDLLGQPVAGLPILFEPRAATAADARADATLQPMVTGDGAPCRSRADGTFELRWPGWPGSLTAEDDGWVVVLRAWCGIEPPTQPPIVLVARPRRYGGTVVDPDGVPIAGATIELNVVDQTRFVAGSPMSMPHDLGATTSAADGTFRFARVGFVPGVVLAASCEPFRATTVPLPETEALDLRLQLGRNGDGTRVFGLVLDGDGRPASGVHVSLTGEAARTGADGRFELPWSGAKPPSLVHAVQRGVGAATARLVVGSDQPGWRRDQPVVLQLPAAPGSITGRVVDVSGEPVMGAWVWTPDLTWFGNAEMDRDGHRFTSPSSVEGMIDDDSAGFEKVLAIGTLSRADGTFSLHSLTARPYALFALAPGSLSAAGPVSASPGAEVELRLGVEPSQRIAGRLVDEVGRTPLAGIRVTAGRAIAWQRPPRDADPWAGSTMPPPDARHSFHDLATTTDDEGRFELPALAVDGAFLSFEGDAVFLPPRLALRGRSDLERLEVALPARSTFEVELARPDEADAFWIADAGGQQVVVFVRIESAEMSAWRVDLVDGRSPPAYCRAGSATLVLVKGSTEVRRVRVELPPGGVHRLRP